MVPSLRWYILGVALGIELFSGTRGVAEDTHRSDYAAGCKALRFFDWQKAEFWFREAFRAHPQPFGKTVQWSGENSQIYLPRYAIGVSLFGLGRYDEALREWEQAEEEWAGVTHEKASALEPYLAVIREGRTIYSKVVCGEVVRSASSSDQWAETSRRDSHDSAAAEGAEAEIRALCLGGQFSAAVERARAWARRFESSHIRREESTTMAWVAPKTTFENVPAAFAQEVSDCEAPRRLRPRFGLARIDGLPGFDHARATFGLIPASLEFGAGFVGAGLARAAQPPRTVTAGPTMVDLSAMVDKIYGKKVALLVNPDYTGSQWPKIEGGDETVRTFKRGLERWGFRDGDIQWIHGFVRADELQARINAFIRVENAAYGTKARNLVLVYFLGHAYRQDDNDSGLLITSDSPRQPHKDNHSEYKSLVEKSISASIVMTFLNQAPHHLVFLFDSCSFGNPLLRSFEGEMFVPWESAWKNPALLLIARSAPVQASVAEPALTSAVSEQLRGCGHSDKYGVVTGFSLFLAVAQALHEKAVSDPQTLKYGQMQAWRDGDVVLRAPADCRPATNRSQPDPRPRR